MNSSNNYIKTKQEWVNFCKDKMVKSVKLTIIYYVGNTIFYRNNQRKFMRTLQILDTN